MTLAQFLKDYLYIPLGGNRQGKLFRYRNLILTMLLGGLWHGASWTFVAWGGLHGLYLTVNHFWHELRVLLGIPFGELGIVGKALGVGLTFIFVVLAWVVFRAKTISGAFAIFTGMAGINGVYLPEQVVSLIPGATKFIHVVGNMTLLGNGTVMGMLEQACLLATSFAICWMGTTTQAMSQRMRLLVIVLSFAFVVQALFFGHEPSDFLYFQF